MRTKSRIVDHEAAHAVMAYKLGLKFNYSEVFDEQREDGARAIVNFEGTKMSNYEGFLIVCAGTVWINNQYGRNDPLVGGDLLHAKSCASDLGKTVEELYPKAQKEILNTLENNWELMDFVTGRLYGNNKITYRELELFELRKAN